MQRKTYNKKNVCCIFNLAPHYRAPIYSLMDRELNCDFYFGDTLGNQIKLMDYRSLKGFKEMVRNVRLTKTGFIWQNGVWKLVFKPYEHFIITGSPALLSNWLLAILAIILRKKVYAWSHGLKKPTRTKGDLFRKLFYKLCYRVFLYGDYSKKIMLREGFLDKKLVPVYNSLNYDKQLKIREDLKQTDLYERHFENDYPVLIYIGRIQKSKKLDMLVYALQELRANSFECNLVLIGADVENNEIADLVKNLSLNKNVWLYGPCYDEAMIGEFLFNADLCVSPGPVGLTALHALTFGCPLISNDDFENQMPEHEAIIEGENGDFYQNNNLVSLVKTIKKWLYNTDEKRKEARESAFKTIDNKWNPHYQLEIIKRQLNL